MAEPTDQIPVLRVHLDEIHRALDNSFGFHVADDLARQYKNVGGTHRPSNLTKALETALNRVEGYLAIDYDDISDE